MNVEPASHGGSAIALVFDLTIRGQRTLVFPSLPQSISCSVCNCCEQSIGILPGVQASMLYNDWNISLDHAGIIGSSGNWFGIAEIVKTQMLCPVCRHGDVVRPHRVFVREIDGYLHMGILVRNVEQASRLVAGHFRVGSLTRGGNVAFGNCPALFTDSIFQLTPPYSLHPLFHGIKLSITSLIRSPKPAVNDHGLGCRRTCRRPRFSSTSKCVLAPFR